MPCLQEHGTGSRWRRRDSPRPVQEDVPPARHRGTSRKAGHDDRDCPAAPRRGALPPRMRAGRASAPAARHRVSFPRRPGAPRRKPPLHGSSRESPSRRPLQTTLAGRSSSSPSIHAASAARGERRSVRYFCSPSKARSLSANVPRVSDGRRPGRLPPSTRHTSGNAGRGRTDARTPSPARPEAKSWRTASAESTMSPAHLPGDP